MQESQTNTSQSPSFTESIKAASILLILNLILFLEKYL